MKFFTCNDGYVKMSFHVFKCLLITFDVCSPFCIQRNRSVIVIGAWESLICLILHYLAHSASLTLILLLINSGCSS